jgi:hypothetical protein
LPTRGQKPRRSIIEDVGYMNHACPGTGTVT